jgi:hypothetical protein
VERRRAATQETLDQIADRIADIASRFTTVELGAADISAAAASSEQTPDAEVSDAAHPLVLAMLEAESNRGRDGWEKPPQLYALVGKTAVIAADPALEAIIGETPEGSLIPVKQQPLPPGEPAEVLADVHWPEEVAGCVLVTELVMLPPEAEDEAPADPGAAEERASGHRGTRRARLAVGVTRNGQYTCILRMQGEDSVQLDPRLADDLVAALLATF